MLDAKTPRQRATFALALGYSVLNELSPRTPGWDLAVHALDEASLWVSGEAVSARSLTDLLMDEQEQGVLLLTRPTDDRPLQNTWLLVETALGYVAWHAWLAEGVPLDPLLTEFDETALDDVCLYAVAAGIDPTYLIALRRRVESLRTASVPTPKALLSAQS